jgi:PAS domain S-box-containing protein
VNDARLRAVSETTRAFMEATVDLDTLLQTIVERLSTEIGDLCSIMLPSDDRSTLVPTVLADRDPSVVAEARRLLMEPLTLDRHPELAHALASVTPIAQEMDLEYLRPRSTPAYMEWVERIGMHGLLFVALRVHGESIGLLAMLRHRATPAPYSDDDLALAKILADHAALAITNARLHAADQSHRRFFEKSPLPNFIFDPATQRVLEVNDAALALYGYTREQFLALDISRLRPPETAGQTAAQLAAAGNSDVVGRRQVRRYDGKVIDVEVWSTVARYRGRNARYVAITDISDRVDLKSARESEAEVRQLAIALEAANRELEAFSYSVAHDLRAPLRGVNGFAQILLEEYGDKLDQEGVDCIQTILSSSKKMGSLIDALLSLARTSRTALHTRPADLSSIARSVAAQLAQRHPDRSVDVVIEDGLHGVFDPQLVEALLDNLLGNAWKFTAKVPHAKVELVSSVDAGVTSYCVRDNGAGFDMQYAGKLFAPFQRMHASGEFPGTGVGLATVQRIVHRHGGWIRAEAAPGKGAAFHFTLSKDAES